VAPGGYAPSVGEWPEAVRRVSTFLRDAGAEARIEEFSAGTPTAVDAARAVGCTLGQIVKSLVFDCDGKVVVVLVPGDRRADAAKVARAAGAARARVAGREEVERATGFAPGAVAPFPLPDVHDVLVDRRVLLEEVVWVGAGSPSHMAGVAPAELVRLARARPMDAVESGE
jgi:prolyl-tRNA editing enzyme YbaK/EbsC (Cys-tRNA(Pro) deacylase)